MYYGETQTNPWKTHFKYLTCDAAGCAPGPSDKVDACPIPSIQIENIVNLGSYVNLCCGHGFASSRKRKEKYPKKPRLNKYQRKVANAKERERMKRMNEVFERLKKHVPMEQLNSDDGKDKKVFFIYHFSLV